MKQVIVTGFSIIAILIAVQVAVALNGLNNGTIETVVNQLQGAK
jgi:hypothetical protein